MPGTHAVRGSPRSRPRRTAHKAAAAGRVPRRARPRGSPFVTCAAPRSAGIGRRGAEGRDSPAGRGRGPFRPSSLGGQTKAPVAKLKCPRGYVSRGGRRGGAPRPSEPQRRIVPLPPPRRSVRTSPGGPARGTTAPASAFELTRKMVLTAPLPGRAGRPCRGRRLRGRRRRRRGGRRGGGRGLTARPLWGPARTTAQLCALRRPRRVPAAGSWRAADAAAYIRAGAQCAVPGREEPGGEAPS